MPATPHLVSRDEAVLVVIDIQERLASAMPRRDSVVAAASRLVRTAALLRWPVIVTLQNPQGLGGLVPELESLFDDPAISSAEVTSVGKTAFCACRETAFAAALEASGKRQVVVCGMEAHICIAQTALALLAAGHEVFVPADACCSIDETDAEVAFDRLRAAGVEVTTSQAVMYEAVGEAGTGDFRALLRIVKGG